MKLTSRGKYYRAGPGHEPQTRSNTAGKLQACTEVALCQEQQKPSWICMARRISGAICHTKLTGRGVRVEECIGREGEHSQVACDVVALLNAILQEKGVACREGIA
eukprot:scaffold47978_cov21-Tisochrysis_lutea.AAC.1